MKEKIAIFGIGNPYRQDDGLGPNLVTKIRKNPKISAYSIHDVSIDIFGVEKILERKLKLDLAIFIDAASSTVYKPGTILLLSLKDVSKKETQFTTTTHGLTIINFLQLLSKLRPEIIPKRSLFLAVIVSELGFGEGLSEIILNKLAKAEEIIESIILKKQVPKLIPP